MSERKAPYHCIGNRGVSRKHGVQSLRRTLILEKTLRHASGIYVWKKVIDLNSVNSAMYLALYLLENGNFAYYGCWPELEYSTVKGCWKQNGLIIELKGSGGKVADLLTPPSSCHTFHRKFRIRRRIDRISLAGMGRQHGWGLLNSRGPLIFIGPDKLDGELFDESVLPTLWFDLEDQISSTRGLI